MHIRSLSAPSRAHTRRHRRAPSPSRAVAALLISSASSGRWPSASLATLKSRHRRRSGLTAIQMRNNLHLWLSMHLAVRYTYVRQRLPCAQIAISAIGSRPAPEGTYTELHPPDLIAEPLALTLEWRMITYILAAQQNRHATGTITGVIEAARHTHQQDTHTREVSWVRDIDSTPSPPLTGHSAYYRTFNSSMFNSRMGKT
jgi:hypothetical protein